MKILKEPKLLQKEIFELKKTKSIGFVPTMGGLHKGHFSLVDRCLNENDICVMSLFLNPTQFDNKTDLETYPSSLEQDLKNLEQYPVDILFLPSFESIYPDQFLYEVIEKDLSTKLCGKTRKGHFNGVLTVVLKLLNIVQPNKAYFGQKDYQQLKLIEGLVEAFFIPTQILSVSTVRDEQGLALSSRNKKLSPSGLNKAQKFAKWLKYEKSINELKKNLEQEQIKIDYIDDLQNRRFAAVNIENVRLIDNVPI